MDINIKGDKAVVVESSVYDLVHAVNGSGSLEEACSYVDQYLMGMGYRLLSVKFCDTLDERPAIRPFGAFPCVISDLSKKMLSTGGCPISKEALKKLSPFDALTIDPSRYRDFLSKRFLDELKKLDHKYIAVVPILIGRGLFICNIGMNQTPFKGVAKTDLVNVMCHVMVNMLAKFRELATYFEPKKLSLIETEIVLLISSGSTISEVAASIGLEEITISIYLDNACKSMGTRTVSQLVAKSLALGEIPDMYSA